MNASSTGATDRLISVIQELSLTRDLESIMSIVRHAARQLTGADGATFVLRDGPHCHYADEDAIAPLWKGKRFPLEACISGWAMLNRSEAIVEDIAPALEGLGCYRRQDEAIRSIVPQYGAGWKCKLVLPSILEASRLNVTRLTVQSPQGEVSTVRLTPTAYLQIVAATNYKQRVRKMTEYYHADRLNYAVVGGRRRISSGMPSCAAS